MLQIEHPHSTLCRGTQWGLSAINKAVWKQGDMLKKIKGAGWHGHHLLESDKGSGALEERLLGPRAAHLDGYPSYWHTCRLISSEKPKHFCVYLLSWMWKNSWEAGWLKWRIIYNPRSVFGVKIHSYFSNPSVVLHGWWLLPHASLTRFKESKITPVFGLTTCQSQCKCLSQISSLCRQERGKMGWRGVRDGRTIPLRSQLKEIICTILWKLYLSGRMVLSKPNSHGGTWFKWRASYKAGRMSG